MIRVAPALCLVVIGCASPYLSGPKRSDLLCVLASDRTITSVEVATITAIGGIQPVAFSYTSCDGGFATNSMQLAEATLSVEQVLGGQPETTAWIGNYALGSVIGSRFIVRIRTTGGQRVVIADPYRLSDDPKGAAAQIRMVEESLIEYPKGRVCPEDSSCNRYDMLVACFPPPTEADGGASSVVANCGW